MEKLYAKQVPRKEQEALFPLGSIFYKNVTLIGNHDLIGQETDAYFNFVQYAADAQETIETLDNDDVDWYESISDCLQDLFPPEHKDSYTEEEVQEWKKILQKYIVESKSMEDDYELVCKALKLITGIPYYFAKLRGKTESDWQGCYYPEGKDPGALEINYFNMGTEWIVHEDDIIPKSPEDINGASYYCFEDPRETFAKIFKMNKSNIILYGFKKYKNGQPTYKILKEEEPVS
ncbi:hypothetical protein M2146_001182 [Lachnospiraceae bacterium PF1-22]